MTDSLIDLNFAPGIRAKDINSNFNNIYKWIRDERIHMGGWGVDKGFDIKANPDTFSVSIGEGSIVTQNGVKIDIPARTFIASSLKAKAKRQITEVSETGIISLEERPYSSSTHNFIEYDSSKDKDFNYKVFNIVDANTGEKVEPLKIHGQKLFISSDWYGRRVQIDYSTAEDRVDSITIDYNGEYRYRESVPSSSPSHIDLNAEDSKKEMLLGVIYWYIDYDAVNEADASDTTFLPETKAKVFINHRTYRCVFVDDQNRLYLNGELYEKGKFIYFEKPEAPVLNDIWYDAENNVMMIWKDIGGLYGWHMINDHDSMPAYEIMCWTPDNNPDDRQTFMFGNNINMDFVPNTHSLSIVVDNAPLMEDQYTEIVNTGEEYMSKGVGFKLVEPLDHDAYIDARVTHRVRSSPLTETFQRGAVFVKNGGETYDSSSNNEKYFKTGDTMFVAGEDQLEVFADGKRLEYGNDFIETFITDSGKYTDYKPSIDESGTSTCYFHIKTDINNGARITYQISKYVWSYEQLDRLIKEIKAEAETAIKKCDEFNERITAVNDNTSNALNEFRTVLQSFQNSLNAIPMQYVRKDNNIISKNNLDDDMRSRVISSAISEAMPANMIHPIAGAKDTDMINVFYISKDMNRILIKDSEYSMQNQSDGLHITLPAYLSVNNAQIYVTGFKLGV